MATPLRFPSEEWCSAVAAALHGDPEVRAAVAAFGAFTAGVVVQRGPALSQDFCVLARIVPGADPVLSFPDDEDELEELEPDYLAWAPVALCRELLAAALGGAPVDPLKLILSGRIKLKGDLQRIVRAAGKHPGHGLAALRSVPTAL
ncbi:MAG: hypothetical protein NVSMB23_05610 [Myxococcales bacterium]